MGNGISVCRLFEEGELAGEKHCDCKLCEDDSSDDDSDSDVGDRREFLLHGKTLTWVATLTICMLGIC